MSYYMYISDNEFPVLMTVLSTGPKFFKSKIEEKLYNKSLENESETEHGVLGDFLIGTLDDIPASNKDLYMEADMALKLNRLKREDTYFFSACFDASDEDYIEILESIERWKNNGLLIGDDNLYLGIDESKNIVFYNIKFKNDKLKKLTSEFCMLKGEK